MKPQIRIHNTETNEIIDREMTDKEYEDYKNTVAAQEAKANAIAQAEADKAALLTKLGISADEAKLLFS